MYIFIDEYMHTTASAAGERNKLKRFQAFHLKAKARKWP